MREVDEEWLCAVLFDEVDRLAGKAVSEIFALRSVGQGWAFIRAEVGWRRALFAAAEVEVEALVFGPMLGRITEVPFSEVNWGSGFILFQNLVACSGQNRRLTSLQDCCGKRQRCAKRGSPSIWA